MTDLTITLTIEEARVLLRSAEPDRNEYDVDRVRVVLDRLTKKIEEAEEEASAYNAAAKGETHWTREQMYQGPSRYAHPAGHELRDPD